MTSEDLLDQVKVALPWCNCKRPRQGYTRRADGVWVKSCCMRREFRMYEMFGDLPIDEARSLDELRSTLADLVAADKRFSSTGTRTRIEQLRAVIKRRSASERRQRRAV